MAKKRIVKNPAEIRQIIYESGLKYVMLNNRLFDDLLSNGNKVEYTPKYDEEDNVYYDHKGSILEGYNQEDKLFTTFNDKDLIIIILLKFLEQSKFKGYTVELANYLNMSEKRLKEHLNKLLFINVNVNSTFARNERKYSDGGYNCRLISNKKVTGWEGNIKRTYLQWKMNFEHDYEPVTKDGKVNHVAKNFFRVTLYDLDLYISGLLNEKEFITYLYFIKSYNENMNIWHSVVKVAEKVNVKNPTLIQKMINRFEVLRLKNEFCDESNKDFPLIHIDKPANYEKRLRNREDPSCCYRPVYNLSIMARLNRENPNIYSDEELEELFL